MRSEISLGDHTSSRVGPTFVLNKVLVEEGGRDQADFEKRGRGNIGELTQQAIISDRPAESEKNI